MQVNISTMNRNKEDILPLKEKLQLKGVKTVFINQNGQDSIEQIDENTLLINSSQKGLSRSRNVGIEHAEEEIILIGDDDLIYYPGFEKKIEDAFRMHPEYSFICFKTNHKNLFFDQKKEKIHHLNLVSVYSVQTAFRKSDILRCGIRFDELFGAGSGVFNSGEENLFVMECLRKGLKGIYLPIEILNVPDSESTWFQGYDRQYFVTKGALFYELYKPFHGLMYLAFALLKYKIYKKDISMMQSMKCMIDGMKKVKSLRSGG